MYSPKVAFIIPTILRDDLLMEVLGSLAENWSDNWKVFVIDQNTEDSVEKKTFYEIACSQFHKKEEQRIEVIRVPFNSGISYCRNIGVSLAHKEGIPFCFIGADSLKFNSSINSLNDVVDHIGVIDKMGFEIENRIPWEGWIKLIPGECFELTYIQKTPDRTTFACNICRNFFVAKTNSLYDVNWDEELVMAEHEDHAWRYSQKYKTFWTNVISGEYIGEKSKKDGSDYAKLRAENWKNGRETLLKKYGLKRWIKYTNKP